MSKLPTWGDLFDYHCSLEKITSDEKVIDNPYYEPFARRRYNFASGLDVDSFRLVFLKGAANKHNKTLFRKGRFIWCKNLRYEGPDEEGYRQLSFTIDKGSKRFIVSENHVLAIPSKSYINNNRYFRPKEKTFIGFSTVFCFNNIISAMASYDGIPFSEMRDRIEKDSPFRPGTLVAPRCGYFCPTFSKPVENIPDLTSEHPYGIILGKGFQNGQDGREFYRVRFGDYTCERVHHIQMEVINEV